MNIKEKIELLTYLIKYNEGCESLEIGIVSGNKGEVEEQLVLRCCSPVLIEELIRLKYELSFFDGVIYIDDWRPSSREEVQNEKM